jgi:hypothetical protein
MVVRHTKAEAWWTEDNAIPLAGNMLENAGEDHPYSLPYSYSSIIPAEYRHSHSEEATRMVYGGRSETAPNYDVYKCSVEGCEVRVIMNRKGGSS